MQHAGFQAEGSLATAAKLLGPTYRAAECRVKITASPRSNNEKVNRINQNVNFSPKTFNPCLAPPQTSNT